MLLGCSLTSDGLDPDPNQINFPMSVLATASDVFVVNSNFDLTFNGAVVQRLGREDLETQIAASRAEGRGGVVDLQDVPSLSSVVIDSHGTPSALSLDGRFLYVPVRSRNRLTAIRVLDSGGIDCGQATDGRCGDSASVGGEPATANADESFPTDPVDVAVADAAGIGGPAGDEYLVVAHRGGRASLFLRSASSDVTAAPRLIDVQDGLPLNHAAVTIEPDTQVAWMPSTALNDQDRSDGRLGRVAVALDSRVPSSSFLFDAGFAQVEGLSSDQDTRDIVFETRGSDRFAYVLTRTPDAVVIVDLSRSTEELLVRAVVPVGVGPSRLTAARLTIAGQPRLVLFASCFDSREIYVIDPREEAAVTVIRGAPAGPDVDPDAARLSGPFTMAFVPAGAVPSARLYVSDFRASTIRVIDLGPLERCLERGMASSSASCEPVVIGALGEPRPIGSIL